MLLNLCDYLHLCPNSCIGRHQTSSSNFQQGLLQTITDVPLHRFTSLQCSPPPIHIITMFPPPPIHIIIMFPTTDSHHYNVPYHHFFTSVPCSLLSIHISTMFPIVNSLQDHVPYHQFTSQVKLDRQSSQQLLPHPRP